MFKRVLSTTILIGVLVSSYNVIKESAIQKGYLDEKKEVSKVEKNINTKYTEPDLKKLEELDKELQEQKSKEDEELSKGEKFTERIIEYIESPVGTESPFYVDGSETGENPVYDGMTEEAFQKPKRNDEYKNSPFYNPETGVNVVEEGKKIQNEMDSSKSPYLK